MRTPLKKAFEEDGNKCFACGTENTHGLKLEFYRIDDDNVMTELVPPSHWHGWQGLMHGGLQCVLLDEITAWAVAGLRDRRYFFTANLEVRYRKPVRLNQKLTVTGHIIQESERGSRVEGKIMDPDNQILSEATATFVYVDGDRFHRIVGTRKKTS